MVLLKTLNFNIKPSNELEGSKHIKNKNKNEEKRKKKVFFYF